LEVPALGVKRKKDPDLDRIQGCWTVAALEVDGQTVPDAARSNARVVVEGNRFSNTGMGAVYKGTIEIDPSARPRRLDMLFDAGPEKGNKNLGIYELDGDEWKICLATRGAVRPSSFATTPGSGLALEVLARGEAPSPAVAKKRAPKKAARSSTAAPDAAPATELEGEWRMVSCVTDGHPMDRSHVQWVERVTRGAHTTVTAGPQVMMEFDFLSDASKVPRTLDYMNTAGPNQGKSQLGIYEIEGGLLRICVSPPGGKRPTRFQSKSGDGRTLTVWRHT
jgi:uncharacterized protein (TIGR03067 family)